MKYVSYGGDARARKNEGFPIARNPISHPHARHRGMCLDTTDLPTRPPMVPPFPPPPWRRFDWLAAFRARNRVEGANSIRRHASSWVSWQDHLMGITYSRDTWTLAVSPCLTGTAI